ncbi:hypothetical protein ACIGCM_03795 [Pseudomonas sp. NPDC078700]|uniref:hypothetical protein n=1 Tax=Pseudomonas sp. NPDC078700 TaxID=3364424 RepID=UPI0037C6C9B3
MTRIKTHRTMGKMPAVVIWQPYSDDGSQEPAIVVQADACGIIVIAQEGREVLIQPEIVPALITAMRQMKAGE